MKYWLTNLRVYILTLTFFLALGVFLWAKNSFPDGPTQLILLTQIYALLAITYLYFSLLATPLIKAFPNLPFRGTYIFARRAIGQSAFFFSLLHACLAFFGQLGGFEGLAFLSNTYLLAIIFSSTALVILTLMFLTSTDAMIEKLTFPKWKMLHRFVYLAAVLITLHALMLGTHFSNLSNVIPQLFFVAAVVLLILEAKRFDDYCAKRVLSWPPVGLWKLFALGLIIFYLLVTRRL